MDSKFNKEMEEEELVKIEETITDEEQQEMKEKADQIKNQGNKCFKNKEFETSVEKYTEALNSCPTKFKKERSILYGNRAAGLFYNQLHK